MSEKAVDTTYRTIRMPKSLRTKLQRHRDRNDLTNQQLLEVAIERQLSGLVAVLVEASLSTETDCIPVRLPFSDRQETLATLQDASSKVGIPMSRLLQSCLHLEIKGKRRQKSRKTR